MTRTGVDAATVQANTLRWAYFVRFDFGGAVGTKRFTDYYQGDFTGSIDGGSQTWTGADVTVGPLDQSRNASSNVSWVKFANLDNQWTTWASVPGIRGKAVQVWRGDFNPTTGALVAVYQLYQGVADDHIIGPYAQVTLKPGVTPWARRLPAQVIGPICLYRYRDAQTCQYSGTGSVTVTAAGSGYVTAPTVVFTPVSGGSGAAGTAVMSGQTVASVTMTATGTGYLVAPTISFTPTSGGSGAAATASMEPAGQTTCPKDKTNGCTPRFNTARWGGFDLMPKPGDIIRWGDTTSIG